MRRSSSEGFFPALLGWIPALAGTFVFSQLAGYPFDAAALRQMQAEGQISERDAKRLSCVFFGGGPSFAVGLIGTQVFGSAAVGFVLLLCGMAANLCLALLIRPWNKISQMTEDTSVFMPLPQAVTESVAETMRGLCGICGIVMAFGVVTWLLESLGILHLLSLFTRNRLLSEPQMQRLFHALLDISQLPALCRSGLSCRTAIPLAAGLLSFGGVGVGLQCAALGTADLSLLRLTAARIFAGILTAFFARILLPILFKNGVAATLSTAFHISESGSVLPAMLIFLTGFPILLKKDWTK